MTDEVTDGAGEAVSRTVHAGSLFQPEDRGFVIDLDDLACPSLCSSHTQPLYFLCNPCDPMT